MPADATLVAQLRPAGAVILGKANLSEWANFRGDASVQRLERARGLHPQPVRARTSTLRFELRIGVGAAANLCAAAIGTETDGSIVCAAGNNLVVGLKPTLGLVSQSGHHPDRAQPGHRGADGQDRDGRGGRR